MAKRSPFLIQGCLSKFSRFMASYNTEKFISATNNGVQDFLKAEETKTPKEKKKVAWLGNGINFDNRPI